MQVTELEIPGVWSFVPEAFFDSRGVFSVWFDAKIFQDAVGYEFAVGQTNHSVSRLGTVRGIHFAQVPPGQGKYVFCPQGRIIDVAVDIRIGSPTFGENVMTEISSENRRCVFLAAGIGHAYYVCEDNSVLSYLCSERYNPQREFGVSPFDSRTHIPWPDEHPLFVSERDQNAMSIDSAVESRILPTMLECENFYQTLKEKPVQS